MKRFLKSLFSFPATKLFSLLLAVLVWLYANTTEIQEKIIDAPVSIKNLDENFVLTQIENDDVKVRLSGRGVQLLKMGDEDVRCVIDAGEFSNGRFEIEISDEMIEIIPANIELVSIEEDKETFINIERRVKRNIPIRPTIVGIPATDYFIYDDIQSDPYYAVVYGREYTIENIQFIKTEPIDINDATETISKFVSPVSSRDDLEIISPTRILVTIPIQQYKIRTFENIKIQIPDGFEDIIDEIETTVDITLKGPENFISKLTPDVLQISLNPEQIKDREKSVDIEFNISERFSIKEISPSSVEVKYKE
jgi:YbbR domain-containing protein